MNMAMAPTLPLHPSSSQPCRPLHLHLHLLSPRLSPFLGSPVPLHHRPFPPLRRHSLPFITAVIKRRKYVPLDNVIQRQKKLKIVSKIKELLVRQPDMVMSLKYLGNYRRQLGLQGRRRVVALLKKYPAVFELFEEGVNTLYFRLTQEAEDQFLEEQKCREEMESVLVTKVRKMLMMSIDKRLLVDKIAHLKRDLGLPDDFKTNFVEKYPQFFKVVETEGGTALELTYWDPELAVSAAEKKMQEAQKGREDEESETISGRPRKFYKIDLPKGYSLKRKDKEVIRKFQDRAFISPYADVTNINPASLDAEKHACAVIHELLTLTLEKRTLVDHLTHFRRDYKFSQRIRGMLIRHPEMFYVSFKGDRDSVFLREAYNGSELIEKDPLVLAKERLGELVELGKNYRINDGEDGENEEGDEDEDEDDYGDEDKDDWSDDDNGNGANSDFGDSDDEKSQRVNGTFEKSRSPIAKEVSVRREPRRPSHIIEKERAMQTAVRPPKERW